MNANLYKRPSKPIEIPVKRRETFENPEIKPIKIVTVDKATECHVTPPGVASRMVQYLGPCGDMLTLEPNAGTGALVCALFEAGQSKYEITLIERHTGLCNHLHELGPTINQCFLEYAKEVQGKVEFPRVIMNPPFKAVKAHINAAVSLLGFNGHQCPARLIALVPVTFEHPGATVLEYLPNTTFRNAKVNTKIIRIERPFEK